MLKKTKIFGKLLKVDKTALDMLKKDVGLQFVVLGILITFFVWLAFSEKTFPYPQYEAIIISCKPIFLIIAGALAIPPISNLVLQMSSKNEDYYDEKPYFAILKSISHIVFSVIIMLISIIVFAYLYVYLQFVLIKWLSFIISAIIIFVVYSLIWNWIKRKWGLTPFGFFSYVKNNYNKSSQ